MSIFLIEDDGKRKKQGNNTTAMAGSRCGRADSLMNLHTTGPSWVQDPVGTVLSTELPTVNHHNSIKLSVRWCMWKVGEGFPGRVSPKTLKWVAVYSSVTFHINA